VHLVTNGKCRINGVDLVGTVPAALAAYLSIEATKPDLVINAGTAGGFHGMGGAIGDVYLTTSVANHDRRIQIPGFDVYGVGEFTCTPTERLRAAMGFKAGAVSTGNSLDWNEDDMKMLKANHASVKEMEAGAIGWACSLYQIPFFCIKSITDIVDGGKPTHEEFLENLHKSALALQSAVPAVVDWIKDKTIEQL